jgi:glycosyltransferase involved in cell wall biosynthesis
MQYFQLNHLSIQHYIKKNGKPDCIHVHVPIKSGIIALWLRWRYGIPYMLTEHYGIYNNRVEESFPKRSLLFKLLTKRIIQSASQFLPVSASIGGNINEMVTKKPFQVIKNTVNTSFFYYVPPPTRSVFIFMHASNMVSVKNVEGIIAGMEALWQYRQDAVLWLTGTTTPSVQKAAAKSALFNKSIFFTGEISYINVALKMQQSHATILFSYSENMPCVILESLCCGRPVIASRVGGIPEVVNDQNGLFVESGNVLQLTNAMLQLMENYSNYNLESIASKAASLYSYSSIGKEMAKIYEL